MLKPLISVVFGSYNRNKFLKLTLDSVRSELIDIPYEIIVIDGGSDDGSIEYLLQQKDVITIVQHNRGIWNNKPLARRSWGYFMNLGFKIAQGKYICMVSDDCLLVPGAIKNGIVFFEHELGQRKKIGAVPFWWRNWTPEQLDYKLCKFFHDKLYLNHGLYLNQAIRDVGYIDEENYSFYAGDVDLCLKLAQNGYACVAAPDSYVEHYPHAGLTVRKENEALWQHDIQNLVKKWGVIGEDLGICDETKHYVDQTKTGEKFKNFEYAPAIVTHKAKHALRWRIKWLVKRIQKIKSEVVMQVNPMKFNTKECSTSTVFSWHDEEFDQLLAMRGKNDDIKVTLKYLKNIKAKILEAGCGTGCVIKYLDSLGFKNVSGIEINKNTVNEINRRYPELDVIAGDILKMPYEKKSFDVVLSYGVIEHFPITGPSAPLKALFNILLPGGIAIITVPSFNIIRRISYTLSLCDIRKWNWMRRIFNKPLLKRNGKAHGWYIDPQVGNFFEYRFTKKQFEQLCINAGFEIIESVPISHIDGLFHSFARPLVTFKNWSFTMSKAGKILNALFSLIPFFHNHMHACVLRKKIS